jgi:mono/diheme cytochrome c family protein
MTKFRKKWLLPAGILIAAVAATGFYVSGRLSAESPETVQVLRPDDRELVRQGAEIYAQSCASCHGENLEGEPNWQSTKADGALPAPPHDETGHTWHHPDDLLFRITKFGTAEAVGLEDFKSNMPAFESSLSDKEIIAALSWIKAQWPEEIRERHDMMNERARSSSQ